MAERTKPLLDVEDGTLVVTLPGPPDAAARRDGIGTGRRSERLEALLAATPLDTWPLDWVALPVGDNLAPAVHAGWAEAARRQRNVDWARALWRVDDELLAVLPRAEAEAHAAGAADPFAAALRLPGSWGPELSRKVLEAIPGPYPSVRVAAYHLDPALAPEAEPLRDLGRRDVNELCDVLAIRAAMLRELS